MTLPSTGVITAAMINVELGRASTAAFNINGAEERALAGKPSGAISFADFRGKSNTLPPIWTAGTSAVKESATGSYVTASINLNTNGTIDMNIGVDGSWLPSGASNGDYEWKWIRISGNTPNGGASQGTWRALSSIGTVSMSASSGVHYLGTLDVYIRHKTSLEQIVKRCTLEAQSSGGGGNPL